jgi:Ni/Fe-hydrogenase subunit HybB-like protein
MNSHKRSWSAPVYLILGAVVAVGLGLGIVRLMTGLGATTSLTDAYPWGLWIVYDVFFVPFSAGAFMILTVAHIYGREEYHAIARPVVVAGFVGELMVVAVLVMDLGRWQQFYNVLFPGFWNIHSFMFQVSICLTVYMAIMVLEVAPALLERLNWRRPLSLIRPLTVFVAGVGIVLSALHQSSLGALFLLMPYKVHPLWWSPLLPLLFFASAAFGGLAMAIIVATASFRAFGRELDNRLLVNLARVAATILGLYLILKLADLLLAGELSLVFSEGELSLLFAAEMVLGVAVPLVLFGIRRLRESNAGLVGGAVAALLGLALNRTTVALLAQRTPTGATYVPHWMEITISVAAVAAGVLLFALAVHLLPILPGRKGEGQRPVPVAWSRRTAILAGCGLVALTAAVVFALQPSARAEAARLETELPMAPTVLPSSLTCADCHTSATALREAGAEASLVERLVVDLPAASSPHDEIDCATCHHGNEAEGDLDALHAQVIADPSVGDYGTCLACHRDLPNELPQDRLRTPHAEFTHGGAVDVYCSDCHGAVGHGFNPLSGDVICPMDVCLDCHIEQQLDAELTDCAACHVGPHDPVAGMACSDCHVSAEVWTQLAAVEHTIELGGRHADVQCLHCHQEQWPLSLECSSCHQPPQDHLTGSCEACHSPEGWASSAGSVVSLASQVEHALQGRDDCLMCHDPAGKTVPAPSDHSDYANTQCGLCHKAGP